MTTHELDEIEQALANPESKDYLAAWTPALLGEVRRLRIALNESQAEVRHLRSGYHDATCDDDCQDDDGRWVE